MFQTNNLEGGLYGKILITSIHSIFTDCYCSHFRCFLETSTYR